MDHLIEKKLRSLLKSRRCTLLGVGPMSKNCVDAAIDLANENEVPILLIASRRQVDSEEFGGGYVNNWTTKEFANYVSQRDKGKLVLLARDHGGPWQNSYEIEKQLNLKDAMLSAKSSYEADILAGFKLLHIDPSIDIHRKPTLDEVLERVFELYDYCWEKAKMNNSEVIFEIGTEEQSGSTNSQEELDYILEKIIQFCEKQKLPKPTFVVIQSGTRVMEMRNVGSFDSPIRVANEVPAEIQVPKMIEICNKHKVFMKEHNTDYLSDDALRWHPRLGIHAANVAPEFGVAETIALLKIMKEFDFHHLADEFLRISYESKKWEKWMLTETEADDKDKALIAGHYVFSNNEFLVIKE